MNEPLKLQATRALIKQLPGPRRQYWTRLLDARVPRAAVGGESEWSLDLANWLDRVYTAVGDEATRVRKEGTAALAETSSAVGYGMWPLALAVAAVLLAYGRARR